MEQGYCISSIISGHGTKWENYKCYENQMVYTTIYLQYKHLNKMDLRK